MKGMEGWSGVALGTSSTEPRCKVLLMQNMCFFFFSHPLFKQGNMKKQCATQVDARDTRHEARRARVAFTVLLAMAMFEAR